MVLDVNIPVFVLGACDDPIVCYKGVPLEELKANPNIIVLDTSVGGHLSWFSGVRNPERWYHKPVIQYLNAIIEYQKKSQ